MSSPFLRRAGMSALVALTLIAIVGLAPASVFAQTQGGGLTGQVSDEQGAMLPGVTITAADPSTGTTRVAVTESDGTFRFPTLRAGDYEVTAELEGFATSKYTGVTINVAQTRSLDIQLKVAALEEVITVDDSAPLVRTEPSGGAIISRETLESLPLNGRQFANLGTLAAGTTLGFNTDPTKPGQQVIAVNGGIGRNVNYMIDGGDNMDDTIGGALQNFSIEAVQEFSIQTQQYKAEYGRSTGGVLSVVTKSGTNEWEGALYGFFRDDDYNAKKESEKIAGADKAPYSREQWGASLGGPIVRDKAHFFLNYEKTDRSGQVITNTGGIYPSIDGTATDVPFSDELIFAKATSDLTPKQYLQFRYGFQKNTDKYSALTNVTPDNFGSLTNEASTALVGLQSQISSTAFNELSIQFSEFENVIVSDSENPTNYFPGGVVSGQNSNTPQTTFQEKRQVRDDFSFSRVIGGRSHDFKTGIEYVDEPKLGGDFPSGLNGLFTRAGDSTTAPIVDITFNAGAFRDSTPNTQWRFYFQDDWQVNDRLTLNMGVRYDYSDVLELDQRSNAIWQTLSTQTAHNEYFWQDFQNGQGGIIEADDNDYSARIGFSWDVRGDGKQLLRGGIGRFYDFPYTNATVLFPNAAVVSLFGVVYNHNNPNGIRNADGSFYQPGQPLPPNQVQNTTLAPAPTEIASPTLATPYSDQISVGYSYQISPTLGLTVEAISIDYEDIPFRFRPNIFENGQRLFPAFGNFRVWYGGGKAEYDGLNLTLRGRVSEKFEYQAFYTLSEATGNVLAGADEFRLTDGNHQPDFNGNRRDVTADLRDPLCDACFGPLNTDARHRVTLAGYYRGPWGLNFSGVYRYRSALPYSAHLGVDVNQDGSSFDLAPGDSVNNRRGASFSQLDLRFSKTFELGSTRLEIIAEVFNVFDDSNPAGFIGNQAAANRNQPTLFAGDAGQSEQRVGQLGVRFSF
jgi:hypothetical protein